MVHKIYKTTLQLTIDRLTSENADFREFATNITDSHTLGKINADCFDRVMYEEELAAHCEKHGID